MSVLSIKDAQHEYAAQIAAVIEFERAITQLGFSIIKEDAFELGEEWVISHNNRKVAHFMWNVPNYITLSIGKHEVFAHDYLGSLKNWEWALSDCLEELESII